MDFSRRPWGAPSNYNLNGQVNNDIGVTNNDYTARTRGGYQSCQQPTRPGAIPMKQYNINSPNYGQQQQQQMGNSSRPQKAMSTSRLRYNQGLRQQQEQQQQNSYSARTPTYTTSQQQSRSQPQIRGYAPQGNNNGGPVPPPKVQSTPAPMNFRVSADQLANAGNQSRYPERASPEGQSVPPGTKYINLKWEDILGGKAGLQNLCVSMVPGPTDSDNRQLKLSFGGQKPMQPGAGGETPLKVVSFEPVANYKGPGGELQSPKEYTGTMMGGYYDGVNMTAAKAGPFTMGKGVGSACTVPNRTGPTVAQNFHSCGRTYNTCRR